MSYGDSSVSRKMVGFAGLDSTVSLPTHNDHNSAEGDVPPIGRGLADRLGVESRTDAITSQGGAAVLAAWKKTRKTPSPKRVVGRTDTRPYDPQLGGDGDRLDCGGLTLSELEKAIHEYSLEGDRHAANMVVDVGGKGNPDWRVALAACFAYYFEGGR